MPTDRTQETESANAPNTRGVYVLFIIALMIITCRPWPNPDTLGRAASTLAEAGVFASLGTIAATLVMRNNFSMPISLLFWGFLAAAYVGIWVSLIANFGTLDISDFIEFARPPYIMIVILIGYMAHRLLGAKRATDALFYALITVGIIQIPICILQLVSPEFVKTFGHFYTSHKLEASSLRATGTFGNPNHLGLFLIIAQITTMIRLSGRRRILVWFLLFTCIALTGSFSSLFLTFFISALFYFYKQYSKGNLRTILGAIMVLGIAGIGAIVTLSNTTLESMPRFERLRAALFESQSGGLLEMSNVQTRIARWSEKINLVDLNDPLTVLFGGGPLKNRGLDAVDNEMMFILLRHGALGLISAFVMLALLTRAFVSRDGEMATFGRFTLFLFVILTPMFDVFLFWRLMPYYLLPFGALIAVRSKSP